MSDAGEYRCSVIYCDNRALTGVPGVQLIVTGKMMIQIFSPSKSVCTVGTNKILHKIRDTQKLYINTSFEGLVVSVKSFPS